MRELLTKIMTMAFSGLHVDGEWHKQWYLEEILKLLLEECRLDLEMLKFLDELSGHDWEEGIIP